MVINEAKNEKIKQEWLLTIKKFNQFTKTDNYFLPNKEILVNIVKSQYRPMPCTGIIK